MFTLRFVSKDYPWLSLDGEGNLTADVKGTTPAEADRRLVIIQELRADRLTLANGFRPSTVPENEEGR